MLSNKNACLNNYITLAGTPGFVFGFGTMYGNNYNGKKLLVMKFGFWDNVRKCSGKKLLVIKLGFWDYVRKYDSKKYRDKA